MRMPRKAQHARLYQAVPRFMREIREAAGLTQRELGRRLGKPQSWVHNCETADRRVDVTEFIAWCSACEVKPVTGLRRLLERIR